VIVSEIITGDAVVVELRLARLASRAVALALDVAVMLVGFLLLLGLAAATGALTELDSALTATVGLVITLIVFVVYPVTLETLTRGRSLGKMALGLRVVRDDGGPIRFRHALSRGLAGFVVDFGIFSGFSGAVGLIASLLSEKGQRIGDRLAGTVVVRERVPEVRHTELVMPPPLAAWAASLSLSQLPDPLALSARQFLQRAADLDPRVRGSLGTRLAEEVVARVSPPPPPGTPAEPFLTAVLAERTRREGERLGAPRDKVSPGWERPTTEPVAPPPADPPPAGDPPQGGFVLPR
jgi:uncharacterized RDD family membrane protein YckC